MMRVTKLLVVLWVALGLAGCAGEGVRPSPSPTPPATPTPVPGTITLENIASGETLTYELLTVVGRVSSAVSSVAVSVNGEAARSWRVFDGRFKCPAPLREGANQIRFTAAGHAGATLDVTMAPRAAETQRVRLVYLLTQDGDGSFQGVLPGEPHDVDTAVRRLRFNALLIQSAYAEMMRNAGRGRKTFEYARDTDGDVVFVERFHVTEADANLYRLVCDDGECEDGPGGYGSTYELWGEINFHMERVTDWRTTKNLVYISFTRFVREGTHSVLYAGGTLGGHHTATVHGGTSLYVFPGDLDEAQQRMYDRRRESDYNMTDYGASPAEFWGAWTGSLGGAAHEVGHSFGLGHASEGAALMHWGYGIFNRLFMPVDGDERRYAGDDMPFFPLVDADGRPHLDVLDESPWFN